MGNDYSISPGRIVPGNIERRVEINSSGITFHTTAEIGARNVNRTEVIKSRVAALEAELAEREKFGVDDFEEGAVLTFSGNYGNATGKKYRFAALKAGGRWWVTGRAYDGSDLTWDALVDFMIRVNARKVRTVIDTVRIV